MYEAEFSSFKHGFSSAAAPASAPSVITGTSQQLPGKSQFTTSTKELLPFIANASLDIIEEQMWSTQALNLGKIDQFYGIFISAYLTQGSIKFVLCYDSNKDENSIRQFFQDVNELYVKILMNPFYNVNDAILAPEFDYKVKLLAKKYL
ncbi:Sedlin, N-terminal conserved region family protein [Candida parapsilosis]|uniref:Trafficking protein particle complex subunit n=2 Tax=Candida parapsilosis TaxID=5480 RepID=G8B608_CANPC|nr:uncharacterized protein CPAR2_109740 [Candida parapsilosis]KAF6043301.1 Sedlin, N-terminal conserved region family protein [Candida parapsilosis]KAF6049121.1 Sedlin, N-terminal conserved region family protein [Candida parapsilosis]KAF6056972.1 Sedlin, N-terminal conserved region family protein [Candida parapsilosis]KAF6066309.1 Sedlin, N-terminal conserved region family protein [Candida parapsilosis]CCE40937.1 hypothetical protein CPAR2_109740 [Candida parapsilosis]